MNEPYQVNNLNHNTSSRIRQLPLLDLGLGDGDSVGGTELDEPGGARHGHLVLRQRDKDLLLLVKVRGFLRQLGQRLAACEFK